MNRQSAHITGAARLEIAKSLAAGYASHHPMLPYIGEENNDATELTEVQGSPEFVNPVATGHFKLKYHDLHFIGQGIAECIRVIVITDNGTVMHGDRHFGLDGQSCFDGFCGGHDIGAGYRQHGDINR